ncbi:MAG: tRNA (adenosine(37)-N6)-threonylcarbamoyltransferase complex dimerization subunit type 1 TsaB [Alphaproteobacteria bacterium]|nr:MAG: tRNA (adenosine(37)-N6)-threonylcarbamoyltransferase complex dimerization subunit type 1 TsaB [Alphaproteobacteria bacterium]
MIILALDSALSSCSAAVIKDGEIVSEIFENRMRGQAERLLPLCQEVCAEAGLSFDDLDAIAVTRGPGTFTGVRIGLAAAKGLALALDIPLIGVTTLSVSARNAAKNSCEGRIAIAHDARRSEVYLQIFDLKAGQVTAVSEPLAVPLAEVATHLEERVTALMGTGAELVQGFLSPEVRGRLDLPDISAQPHAGIIGQMAWERLEAGGVIDEVVPLYLRAPDAVAAKPITYPFQNQ